ncbi:hypothetical protein O181_087711 [Austropuccinia psidii MF-1]|uniref:DUF659 domain-containing protein n=1 Tax=Austropuccinia psidii MF-1 TaxID=1389203 RepID=A0A9Q3IQ61_9BASI|nr:hypothetical protein [Austropuccinia psidii MF-1]
MLCCHPILTAFFSGDHSDPSLANNFLSILKQYSLDDAIICITADNASVNQRMAQEIEKQCPTFTSSTNTIGCMAHVLHLAECEGLRSLADGPTSATTPEDEDLPAPMLIAGLVTPPDGLQVKYDSIISQAAQLGSYL